MVDEDDLKKFKIYKSSHIEITNSPTEHVKIISDTSLSNLDTCFKGHKRGNIYDYSSLFLCLSPRIINYVLK